MTAFAYPAARDERRHGPQGYTHYRSFRPWLRDECMFRCVYCLIREQWGHVSGDFELDHYEPQQLVPSRTTDYNNLVYACRTCNLTKGSQGIPDPLMCLTDDQVIVHEDGAIAGRTEEARWVIRILDLDDEPFRRWRRTWLRIVELAEQYDPELYRELMRFPTDLPRLNRLRPPGGNTRPDGIGQSYFALRLQGQLPETY